MSDYKCASCGGEYVSIFELDRCHECLGESCHDQPSQEPVPSHVRISRLMFEKPLEKVADNILKTQASVFERLRIKELEEQLEQANAAMFANSDRAVKWKSEAAQLKEQLTQAQADAETFQKESEYLDKQLEVENAWRDRLKEGLAIAQAELAEANALIKRQSLHLLDWGKQYASLQAEASRYRKALESIVGIQNTEWPDRIFAAQHMASKALKPVKE